MSAHYLHFFTKAEDPTAIDANTLLSSVEFSLIDTNFDAVPNTENCFILYRKSNHSVGFCPTDPSEAVTLKEAIRALSICRSNGFNKPSKSATAVQG